MVIRQAGLLCLVLLLAAPQAEAKRVDKETLDMVKFFIKTRVEDLPPDYIEGFLRIDPDDLPWRYQRKFRGKRLELLTLKHINKMRKRGSIRRVKADCAPVEGSKSTDIETIKMAGYIEITEDEEDFLIRRTECSEMELMCEFSLVIGLREAKRRRGRGEEEEDNKKERVLFLHVKDPLLIILDEYRSQRKERQTKFFGVGGTKCRH